MEKYKGNKKITVNVENSGIGNETGIHWWQMSLIGIGSIIGAGFFLGTGLSINLAGGSVVFSYLIAGIIVYLTLYALAEMSVNDPDPGSFRSYAGKAFGHRIGYVSGWVYWIAGVLIMSSEITALSIFTRYWFPNVPLWLFSILYSILGISINLLGVRNFGNIESTFGIIKISTLLSFIIFGIIMLPKAASNISGEVGAHLLKGVEWFPNGFSGLWAAMIFALFSFGGIEILGVTATEMRTRKNIPKSVNLLMISLILIYITALFMVINMVPYNRISAESSPFVSALSAFKIPYLSSIFNIIIISAAFSTMIGALFSVTNILVSLSMDKNAPRALMQRNRKGVATGALFMSTIGLALTIVLSFLLPKTVYEYMTTSAGVLLVLNWGLILASQVKRRKEYSLENGEITFKMFGYPYSSYLGIILIAFSLIGAAFKETQRVGLLTSFGIVAFIYVSYSVFKFKKES